MATTVQDYDKLKDFILRAKSKAGEIGSDVVALSEDGSDDESCKRDKLEKLLSYIDTISLYIPVGTEIPSDDSYPGNESTITWTAEMNQISESEAIAVIDKICELADICLGCDDSFSVTYPTPNYSFASILGLVTMAGTAIYTIAGTEMIVT